MNFFDRPSPGMLRDASILVNELKKRGFRLRKVIVKVTEIEEKKYNKEIAS